MKKSLLHGAVLAFFSIFAGVFAADSLAQSERMQEFNIENDAVDEYMATSNATLTRTRGIHGQEFFDQPRSYRPDQPRTKTITFALPLKPKPKPKPKPKNLTATVTMSEHPDMSSPVLTAEVELKDGVGSYVLRNMVPDRSYYYSVSASGKTLTKGSFTTTGQMRMIAIDNGFNIRDLGGWTGWNGYKVRYEALYRGGSLGGTDKDGNRSDISDEDRAELKRIGIRALLDLRAATNAGKYAGESSLHSYTYGASTLWDADYNNTMTDYGAYNQDEAVIADVAWIIHELKQGRPVYFNCRQGADRTGTVAFVIEGLLGCYGDDEGRQMGMDYELTGFSQANLVDNVKFASSYRSATEAYGNRAKLFSQLLSLSPAKEDAIELNDLQEKCYYYLNRLIDKDDLDWFVNYMLGITDLYVGPSWARSTGRSVKEIGESKANVVTYIR